MMQSFITLPGIGGSDQSHWQSHWEKEEASFVRFKPKNWDEPDFENWFSALDIEITNSKRKPILVPHSLSCLLAASYLEYHTDKVAGVFFVAVPDPIGPIFPVSAGDFKRPFMERLKVPSLIIASENDPYDPLGFARNCAASWGSELISIGDAEHISSVQNWPEGKELLYQFCKSNDI